MNAPQYLAHRSKTSSAVLTAMEMDGRMQAMHLSMMRLSTLMTMTMAMAMPRTETTQMIAQDCLAFLLKLDSVAPTVMATVGTTSLTRSLTTSDYGPTQMTMDSPTNPELTALMIVRM